MSEPRPATVAARIVALVAASVLLATAVLFAVTFSGPPPRPAPLQVSAIADALRRDAPPRLNDQGLTVHDQADSPAPPGVPDEPQTPALRDAVAHALGRDRADVRAWTFGTLGDTPARVADPGCRSMRPRCRPFRIARTARL